jgi:cell division septation protein DedD
MFAVSRSVLFVTTLSLFGGALLAQNGKPTPAPVPAGHEKAKEVKETYAVVEVGHHMSTTAESAVETMRKEKHAAFEAAMAEYNKAKAAAEASKQTFDKKAPKEETVTVLKGGLASMADAEKALAELKKAEKAKDGAEKPKAHEGGKKKGG